MDFVGKCDRRIHPKAKATCWISRIFFIYTIGLIRHTSRKKIDLEDIFEVLPEHSSQKLGNMMDNRCKQELDLLGTISVYRLLWTCFGKEYVLTGLLQLFMRTLVVVTIPWTISQLINYFQPNQTQLTKFDAYYLAALLILLNLLNITYLHNYLLHLTSMGIRIRTSFCALIYRKCLRLSAEALSKITVGNIVTLMTKDVAAFETMIMYANDVWIGFVQTVVIFYLLYLRVGVAASVGVGLFLIVIPIQESSKNTDKRLQTIRDAVSSIKIIKMYNWECILEEQISRNRRRAIWISLLGFEKIHPFPKYVEICSKHFHESDFVYLADGIRHLRVNAAPIPVHTAFDFAESIRIEVNTMVKIFVRKTMILLLGGLTSKLAFFAMVMTYVWLGNPISAELVYFILALLQRVRHAFNVVIPMGITESAEFKVNETARVWIKNATVEINRQPFLREITFDICSGLTIVSGPIGSGKSTVLRLLLGEIRCKEGTVHVTGRVSYAPQESWIFPSTLKQNILLGEKFDRTRYEEVLKVCALTVDRDRLPGGDDFIVKEQGSNISSGQKARINLARAIYRNADIYLLDDCLMSLDIHVQEHVFKDCMHRFLNDKIRIFVTQNHHFLDRVDRILWVENGAVVNRLPETVNTRNEHLEGLTGLCIYLRRLSYPNRRSDLEQMFGLSGPYLSDIGKAVMNIIHGNWRSLLINIKNLRWLDVDRLNTYTQGAAVENCWAFIDGTARPICRPTVNQETYYSVYKRFHCLKYQSVLALDGMTIKLLLCPFPNRNLKLQKQAFNYSMKPLQQEVEWRFGKVVNEYAFLNFKQNQKLLLQDVGQIL
nr:unnamed protein product [Callosobruchus chinensis]